MIEGAHALLLRALARRGGATWRLVESDAQPWASATFVGERHTATAELDDAAAERFVAELGEAEFALGGHLVADIAIVARNGGRVEIEALTVEEV